MSTRFIGDMTYENSFCRRPVYHEVEEDPMGMCHRESTMKDDKLSVMAIKEVHKE